MGKFLILLWGAVLVATVRADEPGFWEQLTPAERRAAGLDQLTPDQRAALNRLAERFLHPTPGVAAPVNEQVRQEIRAQAKAEAREEVKAEVREQVRAEVKQEMQAEEKAKATARAGLPPAPPAEAATVRTRIAGAFHGWTGETVFRLANGQTWRQTDSSEHYWVPTMESPEVELRPSALGGWKLYLVEKGVWVRVHRVP